MESEIKMKSSHFGWRGRKYSPKIPMRGTHGVFLSFSSFSQPPVCCQCGSSDDKSGEEQWLSRAKTVMDGNLSLSGTMVPIGWDHVGFFLSILLLGLKCVETIEVDSLDQNREFREPKSTRDIIRENCPTQLF